MKKCSTFLAIKEMKIKTKLRFHPPPVTIATIKNTNNNKRWQGRGGKRTLILYSWERKLMQPLRKTIWSCLKKLKIELLYDPAHS
jgi:hypothetical protein